MGLVGSSGLRIVAAGSTNGSCTINANGAVYAICTITYIHYGEGAATTLYAYAITSSSASIYLKMGGLVKIYSLKLTSSNISVTTADMDTSHNITAIGLA